MVNPAQEREALLQAVEDRINRQTPRTRYVPQSGVLESEDEDELVVDDAEDDERTTELAADDEASTESAWATVRMPSPPKKIEVTIEELVKQLTLDKIIDLDPIYQRNHVWPPAKQEVLIDTVLRGNAIPEIIFAGHQVDGKTRYSCVDGKQRITALRRFHAGEIGVVQPEGKKRWRRFMQMSAAQKAETNNILLNEVDRDYFLQHKVTILVYDDLTPEEEQEIFQRHQQGMVLTQAEKLLNTIHSPMAKWIREEPLFLYFERPNTLNDRAVALRRGDDFHAMALIVALLCEDRTAAPKFRGPMELRKWLVSTEVPSQPRRKQIERVMKRFVKLTLYAPKGKKYRKITTPGDRESIDVLRSERIRLALPTHDVFRAPKWLALVECVWIAHLISEHAGIEDDWQLLEAIDLLRAHVDANHHGVVRNNAMVTATCIDFIRDFDPDEQLQGKYADARLQDPETAVPEQATPKSSPRKRKAGSSASKRRTRKKPAEDGSEVEDE